MINNRKNTYVVQKIISGPVIEEKKFLRRGNASHKKDNQKRTSHRNDPTLHSRNLRKAKLKCAGLLNCNFTNNDYFLTLTYDDSSLPACPTKKELCKVASKNLKAFIKRLAYRAPDLRAVYISSVRDPKTDERVRLHHHIVVGAEDLRCVQTERGNLSLVVCGIPLEKIWKNGNIYVEHIKANKDLYDQAAYMLNQSLHLEHGKKWNATQNLKKPIVSETYATENSTLSVPKGAAELDHFNTEIVTDDGYRFKYDYIRYTQ